MRKSNKPGLMITAEKTYVMIGKSKPMHKSALRTNEPESRSQLHCLNLTWLVYYSFWKNQNFRTPK